MAHNEQAEGVHRVDCVALDHDWQGVADADQPTMSGALFMSGAKLYIRGATDAELVTSA